MPLIVHTAEPRRRQAADQARCPGMPDRVPGHGRADLLVTGTRCVRRSGHIASGLIGCVPPWGSALISPLCPRIISSAKVENSA